MSRPKLIRLTTIDDSLYGLLRGQLRYLSNYYEVIGVANDSGWLEKVAEREVIRTIAIPMRREISIWNDFKSLWLLIKLFRRERPYIVHANTPKASLLGMFAAWIARVPHRIYLVTGLRFETEHGLFRLIMKTIERIICLCATKVIPEGDGVKVTLLRERITRKPMQKIHNGNINGIDLEYFDRTDDVGQRAMQIRSGNFTFIFIGRIVRHKGVNELVEAFDRLSKDIGKVKLLLIGWYEDIDPVTPVTKRIIESNIQIEFVGPQPDVRPYLAASDVLVLPSYREGFPNVVLQGGAMSLPCIVTDISGSNEIIVNGQNGIIIPKQNTDALFDAMKYMYEHSQERWQMASCAREMVVSRYRQQDLWAAMLEMYKSL